MTTVADVYARIRPDGKRFGSEMQSQIGSSATNVGTATGKQFAGGMLAGVGALFAGAKIIDFFKGAFNEASEAARVTRLTNAALKSTGEVAHVTAGDIGDLSDRLSAMAGVDDEVIQSGANVLLTFTRIRNEAGKGNDIFNQGAEAALNLSAALGTDLQASMILVGKALNDPIAGLTALKKAGVQLTEQQREQIKAFVEAGDVMSAQKVILAELTTQFGGAAAAAASPADKARVAWGNFQEEVGNKLLPTLESILTFGVKNQAWLGPLAGSIAGLAVVIGTVIAAQKAWTIVQSALGIGMDATARRASRTALALGAIVVAAQALNAATADTTDVEGLNESLKRLGSTNERGGELARLFGKDLSGFRNDVALTGGAVNNIAGALEGLIPLTRQAMENNFGTSFGSAKEHITQLDDALSQLVRGGNITEARAAVYQLMQAGKITAEEANNLFPKWANANESMQRGMTATAKAEIDASAAGKALIDTWNDLNDTMLSADDAMLAAHESLDGITRAFEEGSKSVDGNSRAAVENRVALERAAAAAEKAAAEAMANGQSHEAAAALVEEFKNQAIAATGATGADAEAIRILAERLFSIPKNVTSQVNVITRNITEYQTYRQGERQAMGGILKFFAGGGFENHVAQISKRGTWRIWGEDETGGEGYIPLAPSKRTRSTAVLAEIADMFGYALASRDPQSSSVGAVGGDLALGAGSAGVERVVEMLARLLDAVERIAPGVGAQLTGATSATYQLARARG
jgi:hypothetical protein